MPSRWLRPPALAGAAPVASASSASTAQQQVRGHDMRAKVRRTRATLCRSGRIADRAAQVREIRCVAIAMHARSFLAILPAALALALPAAAGAYVPANATWSEQYITEPNGNVLHADVLSPKGLAPGAKTPVIVTVSPYTNHSGQQGP